jgi:mono/diheme cytochrome c family protein
MKRHGVCCVTKSLERELAASRGPAMRFILITKTVIVSVVAFPVQATEQDSFGVISAGKILYTRHCAGCHGVVIWRTDQTVKSN